MSEPELTNNNIPNFNDVIVAYDDVLHHNREHTGFGAGFANIFAALVESQIKHDDTIDSENPPTEAAVHVTFQEKLNDKATEGDMHGDLQELLHGDTFMRIGIKLEPFGGHLVSTDGVSASSKELEPRVENTQLYIDFLKTINPDQVEDVNNQTLFNDVVSMTAKIVATTMSREELGKATPEMRQIMLEAGEDALRTFTAIAPEYERLGLDAASLRKRFSKEPEGQAWSYVSKNAPEETQREYRAHREFNKAHRAADTYEKLENYVKYWGRNILPEFVDGGRYLLETQKQGFGPATWHHDGGQRFWATALNFANEMDQEERTREFGNEVRAGLLRSIDDALTEMDDPESPDYLATNRDDLLNVQHALRREDYDVERFKIYTAHPRS